MALYDPAKIRVPEVPKLQKEGDMVLYKKWSRHLLLSLGATRQGVVLDQRGVNSNRYFNFNFDDFLHVQIEHVR